MSTLRRQEPVGLGLRRIACAQVESAIRALTREADKAADALDALRSAQAIQRLIEPDLPRPVIRRDNAIFSRLLEGFNEMTRPATMLGRLDARHKKPPQDNAALASAVKTLRKQWGKQSRPAQAMRSRAGSFDPAIYRLVADMAELRGHLGGWPVDKIADDQSPRGLRRTYAKARKQIDEPATPETLTRLADALHTLDQQLAILSKPCPAMIKAQRKLISKPTKALDQLLQDHALDAALRKQGAAKQPGRPTLAAQAKSLIESDLRPALAETPAAFINRLGVYWSVWRSGAK